ncbi:MAG: hypothetical protein WC802_01610 [Patescibacteria group bacterium]
MPPEPKTTHRGWAIMFILWNFGLLIAIIVLLVQLNQSRVDTKTIAKACAEAAVSAIK